MVTFSKTHTKILVCAADDFRKYRKKQKLVFFFKNSYKNLPKAKNQVFGVLKSARLVCFCLFDLILYIPSTIFQLNRDGSSWVEPVLS